MRSIDDILKLVCGFLNKERVDYVIVGGLAVIFHGIPRTTMDADIILQIKEDKMHKFIDFLKENRFFASLEDMRDAFSEKSHFTAEDKDSMIRLDIKGIYNKMDQQTFERRMDFVHKDTKIYLASPEDTIANKLVYGSEQDIRDAEGIYARQMGKLDLSYLERVCRDMGVADDLERLKKKIAQYLDEAAEI
ncbi:MAG: DUF6036 family nucleotidyltransferase [Candidatus Hydrothermarchaeales archaeon]